MLAEKLRGAVSPDALWAVSEFAIEEGLWGRSVASRVVAGRYRGFQWLTDLAVDRLPDYGGALGEAGFGLRGRRTWLGGLLRSELWRVADSRNSTAA